MANASSPYDCDFESGNLCQWFSNADYYKFEWRAVSGGNPASGTGPPNDASGQANGEYLHMVCKCSH